MCFSATASFTAAGLLALCGGTLVNKFKDDKRKIFIALIPCFFAAQQFSEGVLWEAFYHDQYGSLWSYAAQYVFMFFAYLFWPVWVPLAYVMSEKVDWRRHIMAACLLMGMLFYCYLVFQYFTSDSAPAHVVKHSIVYYTSGSLFAKLYYVAVTTVPILISSIPYMWIVGVLTALAFIVTDYIYTFAYVSLWCFFSALTFLGLYFVLKPDPKIQD